MEKSNFSGNGRGANPHAGKRGHMVKITRTRNPSGKPPFKPTQITKTFASQLRWVRDNLRLTQEEMAKVLGVNLQTYGSYERGEANITIERLREIAQRT